MIAIALSEAAWRSLLGALPACEGCPAAAEVTMTLAGGSKHRVCVACAAQRRRGHLDALAHGDAVAEIESALLAAAGVI